MNKLLPILLVVVFYSANVLSDSNTTYYCLSTEATGESARKLLVLEITYENKIAKSMTLYNRFNPYKSSTYETEIVEQKRTDKGYLYIQGKTPERGYDLILDFYGEPSILMVGTGLMLGDTYSCALEVKYPKSKFVSLLTPNGDIFSWDIDSAKEIGPMVYAIPEYKSYTNEKYDYYSFLNNKLVDVCYKDINKQYSDDFLRYKDLKRIRGMENNKIKPYDIFLSYKIPYRKFTDVLYKNILPNAPKLESYMTLSNFEYYQYMCYYEIGDKTVFRSDFDRSDFERKAIINYNTLKKSERTIYVNFAELKDGIKFGKDKEVKYYHTRKGYYRQLVFLKDKMGLKTNE